jgi:hypothetical protein
MRKEERRSTEDEHMADRHTIVVCVENGRVSEVLFCDCSPEVTLEVRTYTDDPAASAAARPAWFMRGVKGPPSEYQRDERGVYRAAYYEPEDASK